MKIQDLLHLVVSKKASDLHLSTGVAPIIRVDGELIVLKEPVLKEEALVAMLKDILPDNKKNELSSKQDLDFAISSAEGARFRISVFRQLRGIAAAFRAIPKKIPSFEELGFPEVFYDICKFPHGLVLVTGPTGSGKTTTIASMIDYINQTTNSHILTIEDPIEYVYECKKSLVQQREVKNHVQAASDALRSALREDPDFILVGEMRDLETVRLALTAAETGHLVFATLHTNSAAESVDRIVDIFPTFEKEMIRSILAGSLQAVISQELVRKKTGGRIAVQEVMVCNVAIRNMIRENKIPQIYSAIQTGHQKGMRTRERHLKELIDKGIVAREFL
jgi:twitching motility protein PilT